MNHNKNPTTPKSERNNKLFYHRTVTTMLKQCQQQHLLMMKLLFLLQEKLHAVHEKDSSISRLFILGIKLCFPILQALFRKHYGFQHSLSLLHSFRQQWCWVTEWHVCSYWNDREGILPKLAFSFLLSNTLCILALSRKVVSTVRQTEHSSSFWPTKFSYNLFCPQHNIFRSLRKPGFSQGGFSFSPCFHSPYPPQPQLHSSNEGRMKQFWFTIKCHRSPVRI